MTCQHNHRARTRRTVMIHGVRWRIRECTECGHGFVTTETPYSVQPDNGDTTLPLFDKESVGKADNGGVDLG